MKAKLNKLTKDLLKKLEVTPQSVDLTKDKDDTYQLDIKLDEQDTGILIGYHGDTIAALQLILGLMLYKQTGKWDRVIVNIGDYRQKREESLQATAEDTVKRVKFSGEPIALFNLNPFERRVIHMYLKDHKEVQSESEGEGRNRHLIISLKDESKAEEPPLPEEDGSNS